MELTAKTGEEKVAILGYGGIARGHRYGYNTLAAAGAPVKLVALCDIDPQQFEKDITINIENGNVFDNSRLHLYTSFEDLIAGEPDVDTIDICLPTYLHAEYAIKALNAGKNVQSEKPMALTPEDCAAMIDAAKKNGKKLMIGQCLRFDAGYLKIKEIIDSGKYGKVLAMDMHRLSAQPIWGYRNWFSDYKLSGGVTLDMSIHDIDMARYLFGDPKSVTAVSTGKIMPHQWTRSNLLYEDGKVVTIASSWLEGRKRGFSFGLRIAFDNASLVWNGEPVIKVYTIGEGGTGETVDVTFTPRDYMAAESLYLAELVLGIRKENDKNPPESAMTTVKLVRTIQKSAENGGMPIAFKP